MSGRALGPEMQGTDAVLRLMLAICGAMTNAKRRLHCGGSWWTAEQRLMLAILAE